MKKINKQSFSSNKQSFSSNKQGFSSNKNKIKNSEFFDDCPICQAMKEAEKKSKDLSLPELAEAFGKAKKQGAVVGGSIFDKEESIN